MKVSKILFILVSFSIFLYLFHCQTEKSSQKKPITDNKSIQNKEETKKINNLKENILNELKPVFAEIEQSIYNENFEKWKSLLSKNALSSYNNDKWLKEKTEQSELLRMQNIKLKNIQDYFTYVVIPSRDGKIFEVDDIEIISENKVKTITLLGNIKIVYLFIKEDIGWRAEAW